MENSEKGAQQYAVKVLCENHMLKSALKHVLDVIESADVLEDEVDIETLERMKQLIRK